MKTALALLLLATSLHAADWFQILGPSQAHVPLPQSEVVWRSDLNASIQEAKEKNLPLFVTMRCLPCKQCSAFDKEVLEGGPDLSPWLSRFVTVRITNAVAIDLRMFPVEGFQDLDLSWWGWFFSPQGNLYGVYGGRDHVSDATRISKESLVATLMRVLQHHYDPRRPAWNVDGPAVELPPPAKTVRDLPGFGSWYAKLNPTEKRQGSCIHCHQVADILRTPAVEAKKFDKIRDVEIWPLPENVGLTLERDDGLLIKSITPGSPADHLGLRPGDRLGAAAGRRLFSQADLRGVLHRGPRNAGSIDLVWSRSGKILEGTLKVPDHWRSTDLGWRMSISQGVIGAGPGFFPLNINAGKRKQFGLSTNVMAVEPYMGSNKSSAAYKAGLRGNHVVTAVDGISTNLAARPFLVWFKQRHEPGDEVKLTVLDTKGQKQEITYTLSKKDE